jgi:hypothetical protein
MCVGSAPQRRKYGRWCLPGNVCCWLGWVTACLLLVPVTPPMTHVWALSALGLELMPWPHAASVVVARSCPRESGLHLHMQLLLYPAHTAGVVVTVAAWVVCIMWLLPMLLSLLLRFVPEYVGLFPIFIQTSWELALSLLAVLWHLSFSRGCPCRD